MSDFEDWMILADTDDDEKDEDNVDVIHSAWCHNRSGVCLSFAIPIQVMNITEIKTFGDEFVRAVKESYKRLIKDHFYAKTETPIVSSTDRGELIMMWSFQGDDDDSTIHALKDAGIKEVKYE